MFQIIQGAANSVNFAEIINYYVQKEGNSSPSALRKILGHEARIEKILTQYQTPAKMPAQRKFDLWLPKNILAAIDMHVREVGFSNYKTLTEFIYKLSEICENDLHLAR